MRRALIPATLIALLASCGSDAPDGDFSSELRQTDVTPIVPENPSPTGSATSGRAVTPGWVPPGFEQQVDENLITVFAAGNSSSQRPAMFSVWGKSNESGPPTLLVVMADDSGGNRLVQDPPASGPTRPGLRRAAEVWMRKEQRDSGLRHEARWDESGLRLNVIAIGDLADADFEKIIANLRLS